MTAEHDPRAESGAQPTPHHRAPAPDVRPRSPLGTWALLLSAGLGGFAILLSLLWPLTVMAFLFAVWATLKIRPREQRGQGLAILAIVLAVLFGGLCYATSMSMRELLAHTSDGLLHGLRAEGGAEERRERVAAWFGRDAVEAGAVDELFERYAVVVEEVGAYTGEVDLGSPLLGLLPLHSSPSEKEEIGRGIGSAWSPHRDAFWVRARFERAELHLEVVLANPDAARMQRAAEALQKSKPTHLLAHVRFFRAR